MIYSANSGLTTLVKPMKLLFPIDGSECALAALDRFATISHLFGKPPDLVLMNVQLPMSDPRLIDLVGQKVMAQYYAEQSEEAIAPARERLEQRGRIFRVEKQVGDPAQQTVHFAATEQCELIAMGTHGRTALKNLLMGSVATKVLAASKVPVLFLK